MSCPCDVPVHPPRLAIPAGLARIPRQIAGFPELRRAILAAIGERPPLDGWRARGGDDFGVLLVEMWAYVADVTAFYDEVIAHEGYLGTARREPSLRKLVALLGYRPRPATAASVLLAAIAEGRLPVTLPAGTAFRSGAFEAEPPQIFELTAAAVIHPLANRWKVGPPRPPTAGALADSMAGGTGAGGGGGTASFERLLLEPGSGAPAAGDPLLIEAASPAATALRTVESLTEIEGVDGERYLEVALDRPLDLAAATPVAGLKLSRPTQRAGLWPHGNSGGIDVLDSTGTASLVLDGLHRQLRAGDPIAIEKGSGDRRWFRVETVSEPLMQIAPGGVTEVEDSDGDTTTVTAPPIKAPATRLHLDAAINAAGRKPPGAADWAANDAGTLTVRYLFAGAGKATGERLSEVAAGAVGTTLALGAAAAGGGRRFEAPPADALPGRFLIEDLDGRGAEVTGAIDPRARTLTLDSGAGWEGALAPPLTVYGNVLEASRGETVAAEVLGSGDAALASQTFALAKKPLSYVAAPAAGNESGVASTLAVRVGGILWSEVPSFFGAGPEDEIYIVRHGDDGGTEVTFGDGVRGRRLPSGVDNVVASYRFGAGAAAPPAGSVAQLARPVAGLSSVTNPLAAFGGADAEGPAELTTAAPRSALLLGRAVSIQDFEAAARVQAGVRAARAEWRWHGRRQMPVVALAYIGDQGVAADVGAALRHLAEPGVPLAVEVAEPVPLELSLDLEIDPRHVEDDVAAAVREALLTGDGALLAPERIGIGRPLVRSRLVERALSVTGTRAVRQILADGAPFPELALDPGAGRWFDLEAGGLAVNGRES